MKARKPCRWEGCLNPREAGRGCSYCREHKIAARKKSRSEHLKKARKRKTRTEPEVFHVESEPSHALALRMLAGKA